MKFKKYYIITLFSLFIIIITIKANYDIRTENYYPKINNEEYFSLDYGNVYTESDTIIISKYTKSKSKITIINLFKNDSTTLLLSDKVVDLNNYKFNELYKRTSTDTIGALSHGIYILELSTNTTNFRDVIFVNRNKENDLVDSEILVCISDYNWVAYNDFGGRSNYFDSITPTYIKTMFWGLYIFSNMYNYGPNLSKKYNLSINRPNNTNNLELTQWIGDSLSIIDGRRYHNVVSELQLIELINDSGIKYSIIDSHDFEQLNSNVKDKLIVFNGHSEYWTSRMIGKLKLLKENNNFLFFSGNNMYKEIKANENFIVITKQINSKEMVTNLLGTYYDDTFYKVNSKLKIDQNHFLFNGIDTNIIGNNYVLDHEVDNINEFTPDNTVVLGTGIDNNADVILMKNERGYYLLNTSSVGSYNGLKEENFRLFINNYIEYVVTK